MGKVSLTGATAMVLLGAAVAAVLAVVAMMGQEAGAAPRVKADGPVPAAISPDAMSGDTAAQQTLYRYAEGTWASFEAMTDPNTGLPADTLSADGKRSVKTSTTNIGSYIWSVVVAEELGIITHEEAVSRLDTTITTLEGMERHGPSGQYYNWYDIRNGDKLTQWPEDNQPLRPWLSSVDNGWLAVGLQLVRNTSTDPELSDRAGEIYDSMDFGFYYREDPNRILFHYAPATETEPVSAPCCYDTIVSESRIASYVGIGKGEIPQKHYFGANRTFPNTCDWSFQETKPEGFTRTYYGVDVFEGSYEYNGTRLVPSWGGSMFEALMPALFVPEERWAPESWRINHPRTVRAQIHHGLNEAQYGYWGFSPSNVPEGGYSVYGVDAAGMDPNGNPSNNDRTLVDRGFAGCEGREPTPDPAASEYTNGVVTPHAAFLALRYAPDQTMANLANIEQDFDGAYGEWGFRDSVNVDSGRVSDYYLSLDQGMVMAAIGNALAGDVLREGFVTKGFQQKVKPVMNVEQFNVSARAR